MAPITSVDPHRQSSFRWLHLWACLTAGATLVLVLAGGLVTSKGVGMSVPDWPNSYGYNMFFFPPSRWIGGIFYEHTHRLIASAVGLMTAVLAIWLFGRKAQPFLRWTGIALLLVGGATLALVPARWADAAVAGVTGLAALAGSLVWPACGPSPKWLRWLGLAAFAAVVLQGLLGGLRVVLYKDQIGIFHALLAQLFLALTCSIALFTSQWWRERMTRTVGFVRVPVPLQWAVMGTTLLILVQLGLGATMRHQHAGLAIPDFPLAYGKVWPATDSGSIALYNQQRIEVTAANPITAAQIYLQMIHRIVALGILAGVIWAAWLARNRGKDPVRRLILVWLGLLLVQVTLGAATVWSKKAADIATAHVFVGAASLVTGVMAAILSGYLPEFRQQTQTGMTQLPLTQEGPAAAGA